MGYKLDDLSYLHEAVPLNETYKVTKQLCADTNLPEFRRMLNRFVREVVVAAGSVAASGCGAAVHERPHHAADHA